MPTPRVDDRTHHWLGRWLGMPPVWWWFSVLLVTWGVLLFVGGAYGPTGTALLGLFLGGLLLLGPRLTLPRKRVMAVIGLLLLWLALQWLPWWETGYQPAQAARELGLELGPGLVPQPLRWMENFGALLVAVLWGMCCLTHRPNHGVRLRCLQQLALFGGVLGLLTLSGQVFGWRSPFSPTAHVFSVLPGRNQLGLILAMLALAGYILALEGIRKSPAKAVGWLSCAALATAALSGLHARAPILLLAGGGFIWLLLALPRLKWREQAGPIIGFGLFGLAISVTTGVVAWERLLGGDVLGFRLQLWREAISMAMERPLSGYGLGTFRDWFLQYTQSASGAGFALHPEQDWLWWGVETGLIGVALLAFLILLLIRPVFQAGPHFDKLRLAWLLVAALLLGHSLIDVSGHRLITVMLALWALGLAYPSEHAPGEQPYQLPRLLQAMGGGLVILLGGVALSLALLGKGWTSESLRADARQGQPTQLARAAAQLPLSWEVRNAVMLDAVRQRNWPTAAEAARQTRFLAPTIAQVGLRQAFAFYEVSPGLTLDGFRQAIRSPQQSVRESDLLKAFFRRTINDLRYQHAVFAILRREAHPELVHWLLSAPEDLRGRWWREILAQDPRLKAWSAADLAQILPRLSRDTDHEPLMETFAQRGDLKATYWTLVALQLAREGRYAEARELRDNFWTLPEPVPYGTAQPASYLRRQLQRNPGDLAALSGLLSMHFAEGRYTQAQEDFTLFTEWRRAPQDFLAWRAHVEEQVGNDAEAWQWWGRYFRR